MTQLICVDAQYNEVECESEQSAFRMTKADLAQKRKDLGLEDAPEPGAPVPSSKADPEPEPETEAEAEAEEAEAKAQAGPAANKAKQGAASTKSSK
jgi:hypothetical protein